MQKNKGRPRTGWDHKRTTVSYPKEFEVILKQVKEWNPEVSFSKEFVKAMKRVHKKLARQMQHYEKGRCQITVSKLAEVAKALGVKFKDLLPKNLLG